MCFIFISIRKNKTHYDLYTQLILSRCTMFILYLYIGDTNRCFNFHVKAYLLNWVLYFFTSFIKLAEFVGRARG